MNSARNWLSLGASLAGLAVVAGAFGAHGLDSYFTKKYATTESKTIGGYEVPASYKYLQDFKTGARYQMYHALGLVVVGLMAVGRKSRTLQIAGWSFLGGIVLFSGSLYILTIGGPRWMGVRWGIVAPFGGMLMIVGWFALAAAACCGPKDSLPRGN